MTAEYITAKDTAKLLRAELKTFFPETKFSVRTDRTRTLTVSWTDGPSAKLVNEVAMKYEGEGFDGMEDMRYSKGTKYGTAFVFTRRNVSEEAAAVLREEIAADIQKNQKVEKVERGASYYVPEVIHREDILYPYSMGTIDDFVTVLSEARNS
jgi:hypothetical protein